MRRRIVLTILKKELLDTIRDKRTLIMMVGVPIVLYPAMMIISMQAMLVQQTGMEDRTSKVAVMGEGAAQVKTWLKSVEKLEVSEPGDPAAALSSEEIDVLVKVEGNPEGVANGTGNVQIAIQFDGAEIDSRKASDRVEDGLRKVSEKLRDARLATAGLKPDFIEPLKLKTENVAPATKTTGTILGSVLPMLLILMIAVGAFYPAVDVTAGEKERGTFETLLSTPTTKSEIVTGKFLTVFALAMLVGLLNLTSMAATMAFMLNQLSSQLDKAIPVEIQFPPMAAVAMVLVMLPLSFFITAVMMCIAVFAKSFKEAQNYVTPFLMVLLFPAMLGSFPGVELTNATQFIPVTNVVLLFRELLTGSVTADQFFSVFMSTFAFALLALQFASWLFQREEVILSEDKGFPLSLNRKYFRPRASMGASMALGYFAILLIVLFYLASLVQQWDLIWGLFITQWVFLLAPTVLLLWFVKVDLKEALSLRRPPLAGLLGTVCMAASALPLLIQFDIYQNKVLPVPKEFEEAFAQLLSSGASNTGLFTLLFVVAFSPAVCEEVVFRGALLSGLRERLNPWVAMIAVGLLFGLFHLSIFRIVPTALLGMVLTYAVVRTGSLYTGILMHFINNAASILLATGSVQSWIDVSALEKDGLPAWALAGAAALFAVGVILVETGARNSRSPAPPRPQSD
ncbi:MAG: CPBP family intramembrane metalloprotease [Candidatus Hydrogenedentes bacterium]|nr:CPBP family intramembrane metalloprotease [Candidatus Hydrogenedentota bacterium]